LGLKRAGDGTLQGDAFAEPATADYLGLKRKTPNKFGVKKSW
jgi:hypothetical protein